MDLTQVIIITSVLSVVLFVIHKLTHQGQVKAFAEEFKQNRQELSQTLFQMKEEITRSNKDLSESLLVRLNDFGVAQQNALDHLKTLMNEQERVNRKILIENLEKVRNENETHLEKIRATVDDKLHTHLEKKLAESFKHVSERLELVHKGLGEMRTLADGVGDLKKVLTNVKTKGILGEYQLQNILEQILAEEQFLRNAETKKNSNARVEFAIKIPDKSGDGYVLLPIDSKFPTTSYEQLLNARHDSNKEDIRKYENQLYRAIKTFAKDISDKYIDSPATTEFAIMFLPVEGLYAEVINNTELFNTLQSELKICVAGPTTLSAFLNSLQMGFKTLALERRSSEVWKILSATKAEFGKFGDILDKVEKKLSEAQNVIGQSKTRSRAIIRKLKDVETLPQTEQEDLFIE
ncbi:MAG: DNA recombination protein RmuC [Bacteriovoracaceae bacterium]